MRTGAMVLGIIGGVVGVIVGIISLTIGGLSGGAGSLAGGEAARAGGMIALWGFLIFVFAVLGLIWGAIAKANATKAGILMLTGGVGGFLSGWFWLFPGILLIVGGILALSSKAEKT